MSKELVEGLKELLRTALLAVVPLLIAGLQAGEVNLNGVLVAAAIAVLSGVDKWLHKENKGINDNGLTGF